ncbi:unnamed protein product [Cuscuta campestris]|uniref:GTD-binding domain-containing protein n=1 Tax=Cuscuta campestris TaxID=132261 RepID=A0A484NLF2_9ASTE|nr:unnamed protein product [Cuscuta campestris]
MTTLSFRCFVEQNVGRHGLALISALLEFVMILLLLLDGFLAFFSSEFARLFELGPPCSLCTRIHGSLAHRNSTSYWNGSVCEDHMKDISSLAYCHAHKMLSDIRTMCEGCLLSFNGQFCCGDDSRYKSLVGILHNDNNPYNCLVVDSSNDPRTVARFCRRDVVDEGQQRCSCCGEIPRRRMKYTRSESVKAPPIAPPHTPRTWTANTEDEMPNLDLSQISCAEKLKWILNNDSALLPDDDGDDDVLNGGGGETSKSTTVPLQPESWALHEEACKTPSCSRVNKFSWIPLSDSTQASPRWCSKKSRKMSIDVLSDLTEMKDDANEGDGGILFRLQRQVLLDRKALMTLHMELDEERGASAVAANNAMAMITRLQAEKAAIQMEALQHQRMMEEHADYYREELQVMRNLLLKREEEVKVLESELEMYRDTNGLMFRVDSEICEVSADEDYRLARFQCNSPFSEISDFGNRAAKRDHERAAAVTEDSGGCANESLESSSLETERSLLLSLLSKFEKKLDATSDEGSLLELKSDRVEEQDPQNGSGNKEIMVCLAREVATIREKLRTIEAESDFIKRAAMTLQRGDEGIKLLTEISDYLRMLRKT